MGEDAEYGLVFDFGIDGHQLDGLTPQEIFVLGFEMAQIWERLSDMDGVRVKLAIRPGNLYRARTACAKLGWSMTSQMIADNWVEIEAVRSG